MKGTTGDSLSNCVYCDTQRKGFTNQDHHCRIHPTSRRAARSFFSTERNSLHKNSPPPHLLRGLGLQPAQLVLEDENTTITAPICINTYAAKALKITNKATKASIRYCEDNKQQQHLRVAADVDSLSIKESRLDAITKLLGAYDFYADQDDTISNETSANNVVNYFTGAIISVGDHAFLLLSVEAYERDAFADVHSEKTASTFPEAITANTRRYRHTTLAYKEEEVDGGDTVKLSLASSTATCL